jgi:hypothetical protein
MYKRGAGECFFAELDMENKRLLVERAIRYYAEKNETNHLKNNPQ